MNKVLVTGANGYLGARLGIYLSKKGYNVSGLCYPEVPNNPEWKSHFNFLFSGDIRKSKTIKEIAEIDPMIVIQLISLDQSQSNTVPGIVNDINVSPTWNILESLKLRSLEKFIYFSTIQVYGRITKGEMNENKATTAENAYGLSHLLSEIICEYYNRTTTINCINVRLTNSYGSPAVDNRECWKLVVNDLCRSAHTSNEIIISSDGSPQRDFIHWQDVCHALNILIEKASKTQHNVYHISSGNTYTIRELSVIVAEVFQKRYNRLPTIKIGGSKVEPVVEADTSSIKYHIKNRKLKSLGFIPQISLEDGVNEVLEYLERSDAEK